MNATRGCKTGTASIFDAGPQWRTHSGFEQMALQMN